jgi:hypothetical protein
MVEYIYYSGIGAKKSEKHTVKEFLEIMNKHFNIECSEFLADLEYKPCVEYKEMNRKAMESDHYTRSKKDDKKYQKLANKCNKHKKTAKKRRCNVDEYSKFSGAQRQI